MYFHHFFSSVFLFFSHFVGIQFEVERNKFVRTLVLAKFKYIYDKKIYIGRENEN